MDRYTVALHEARHAVVARLFSLETTRVAVTSNGGYCEVVAPSCDSDSIHNAVLMTLAGIAGDQQSSPVGGCNDLRDAEILYKKWQRVTGELTSYQSALPGLLTESRWLVIEHEQDIRRIAEALLEHSTLTSSDITRLWDDGGTVPSRRPTRALTSRPISRPISRSRHTGLACADPWHLHHGARRPAWGRLDDNGPERIPVCMECFGHQWIVKT